MERERDRSLVTCLDADQISHMKRTREDYNKIIPSALYCFIIHSCSIICLSNCFILWHQVFNTQLFNRISICKKFHIMDDSLHKQKIPNQHVFFLQVNHKSLGFMIYIKKKTWFNFYPPFTLSAFVGRCKQINDVVWLLQLLM